MGCHFSKKERMIIVSVFDDEEKIENMILSAHAINQDISLIENEDFLQNFLGDVFQLYEEEMNKRNNADYEINSEQMAYLANAYRFFVKKAHDHNGKIDPFFYNPKEEVGHLDAHFYFFELSGEDLLEFSEILKHFSVITIDATLDGVTHFSINVPNVYRKKNAES